MVRASLAQFFTLCCRSNWCPFYKSNNINSKLNLLRYCYHRKRIVLYCIDPTVAVITAAGAAAPTCGRCVSTCAHHPLPLQRKCGGILHIYWRCTVIWSSLFFTGDIHMICMPLPLDTSSIRMPRYGSSTGQKCTGADKYVINKIRGTDGKIF